ncbi:MAG: hypothetical protein HYU63_07990 [Armatimonadetes bacterium]|nr:hypothetical protein [Armatimonadota bacterium]
MPDFSKNQIEKHHIEVLIKEVKDKKNQPLVLKKDINLPVDSLGNPVIKILFIPLKIGNWNKKLIYFDQAERLDKKRFKNIREGQISFLKSLYPFPPENIIDSTTSNIFMDITPSTSENLLTGVTKMGLLSRLEDYYNDCKKEGINYVVGITPENYLGDMGATENSFPHAILLDENAPFTIVAHELAHLLGLKHNQDEYGKQMLADKGYQIKSINPIVYIRKLSHMLKVEIIDFMDIDPKTDINTWICKENYDKLINKIKTLFKKP